MPRPRERSTLLALQCAPCVVAPRPALAVLASCTSGAALALNVCAAAGALLRKVGLLGLLCKQGAWVQEAARRSTTAQRLDATLCHAYAASGKLADGARRHRLSFQARRSC